MINIYYCLDKKYFNQLFVSLISLVENCKEPINLILLTLQIDELFENKPKLTEEQRQLCEKLLQSKNPDSKVTVVDVSDLFRKYLLPSVNLHNKFYHYYVCTRLLADKVEEIPSKVIYCDTDVIFNKDINALWNLDNTKYELMGRKEPYRITKYINTGVMLLNMDLIRKNKTFEKSCFNCKHKKILAFIDMTALNRATKSIKYISKKYNSFVYKEDNVIHHLCVVREGKLLLSKKWRHRIKPNEEKLLLQKLPQYKKYYIILNEYRKQNQNCF